MSYTSIISQNYATKIRIFFENNGFTKKNLNFFFSCAAYSAKSAAVSA
jgi:hypothetical protein